MNSPVSTREEALLRLRVAVVGDFQIGKSLLVNCLLGKNMAETGRGKTTTHANSTYSRGQFDLIDTPGFGAGDSDNKTAEEAIKNASAVLFVCSGKMLDKVIYKDIIDKAKGKSCIFLLNCNNEENWSPDDDQNESICKTIEGQLKNYGWDSSFAPLNGRLVTPLNVFWAACGLRLIHDKRKIKKVRNYIKEEGYGITADDKNLYSTVLARSGFQVVRNYMDDLPLNLLLNSIKDANKQINLFTMRFCDKFRNLFGSKEAMK